MTEKARIVSINVSEEKGTIKRPIPKAEIDELGIVGDAHSGLWHRQVSFLSSESILSFSAAMGGRQILPGEFAENITTENLDISSAAILDRFQIGGVELEVTQIGKECHGDSCAIFREIGKCVMPKDGIFCRVLKAGKIKTGDEIVFTPRPFVFRVITVSDRASKGVYEDRSGPRIVDLINAAMKPKRWRPTVESSVIPDDAEKLRNEIRSAVQKGVDVLVTTGGTGIGPKDLTPDVVTEMCDKLVPGIMEYIRWKFGKDKPNALLSRSVAGVIDRTLVFSLPGSVRGAQEYMGEILPMLDHLVFMLHGLDTH